LAGRSFGPGILRRSYRHLLIAYDPREWWQHDGWSPRFDARIPLRDHEPAVARAGYDFTVIEQPWLREALKWQLKTALETGLLRWASVLARLGSLTIFSQFIAERGIHEPRLCADRAELRLLALDFLAHVKQRRARCGANRGELVTNGTVRHTINHVERFYAFMADYKQEAARALGDPRWEALGDQHARLWRPGEKPLPPRLPDEDVYFDVEITDHVEISSWSERSRLIARRTKLTDGDQQSFADHDGYRLSVFLTNQPGEEHPAAGP
jgi:hypothetical protein